MNALSVGRVRTNALLRQYHYKHDWLSINYCALPDTIKHGKILKIEHLKKMITARRGIPGRKKIII